MGRTGGHLASLEYSASGRRSKRIDDGTTSLYPTPRLEQRGSTLYRIVRAGPEGEVVAEVENLTAPPGAKRTRILQRDGSHNVGHVARKDSTSPNATLESSPRRWTAFGSLRAGTATAAIERGYASQPLEGSTGLVYMRARHCDPVTGRFLQSDPIGIESSQLYAYAANNPYLFWDPTGLMPNLAAIHRFLEAPPVPGFDQLGGFVDQFGAQGLTALPESRFHLARNSRGGPRQRGLPDVGRDECGRTPEFDHGGGHGSHQRPDDPGDYG